MCRNISSCPKTTEPDSLHQLCDKIQRALYRSYYFYKTVDLHEIALQSDMMYWLAQFALIEQIGVRFPVWEYHFFPLPIIIFSSRMYSKIFFVLESLYVQHSGGFVSSMPCRKNMHGSTHNRTKGSQIAKGVFV